MRENWRSGPLSWLCVFDLWNFHQTRNTTDQTCLRLLRSAYRNSYSLTVLMRSDSCFLWFCVTLCAFQWRSDKSHHWFLLWPPQHFLPQQSASTRKGTLKILTEETFFAFSLFLTFRKIVSVSRTASLPVTAILLKPGVVTHQHQEKRFWDWIFEMFNLTVHESEQDTGLLPLGLSFTLKLNINTNFREGRGYIQSILTWVHAVTGKH